MLHALVDERLDLIHLPPDNSPIRRLSLRIFRGHDGVAVFRRAS